MNTTGKNNIFRGAVSLFIAALLLLLMTLFALSPSAAATSSAVKTLEDSISATEDKIAALESKITSTEGTLMTELQRKEALDSQLTLLGEKIGYAQQLAQQYELEIAEKEREIANGEGTLENRYQDFLTWMRMDYEYDTSDVLALVLDADSLDDFLSNAERMGTLMSYQAKLMDELSAEISGLEAERSELEIYRAAQEKALYDLNVDREKYEQLLNQSASYINRLKSNKSAYQQALEDTVAEFERLNKELEEELRKLAEQNSAYVGGAYLWPLDQTWTRISSPFGWREYPVHEYHTGIDVPANAGVNIYAANSGKIIKSAPYSGYGNCIIIDHGGGQTTLYAHCSKLLVSEGDTVTKGQVIGLVGSTGNSTGNHLHFEVRIDGVAQDPIGYVTP